MRPPQQSRVGPSAVTLHLQCPLAYFPSPQFACCELPIDGITQPVAVAVWLLPLSIPFMLDVRCICTSFDYQTIFYLMDVLYFIYSFLTTWWAFGLFPPGGYCKYSCTSFGMNVLFQFSCYIPRGGITGSHMTISILPCWGTAKLFSKISVSFYIPTNNVWALQYCPLLQKL